MLEPVTPPWQRKRYPVVSSYHCVYAAIWFEDCAYSIEKFRHRTYLLDVSRVDYLWILHGYDVWRHWPASLPRASLDTLTWSRRAHLILCRLVLSLQTAAPTRSSTRCVAFGWVSMIRSKNDQNDQKCVLLSIRPACPFCTVRAIAPAPKSRSIVNTVFPRCSASRVRIRSQIHTRWVHLFIFMFAPEGVCPVFF